MRDETSENIFCFLRWKHIRYVLCHHTKIFLLKWFFLSVGLQFGSSIWNKVNFSLISSLASCADIDDLMVLLGFFLTTWRCLQSFFCTLNRWLGSFMSWTMRTWMISIGMRFAGWVSAATICFWKWVVNFLLFLFQNLLSFIPLYCFTGESVGPTLVFSLLQKLQPLIFRLFPTNFFLLWTLISFLSF